MRVVSVGAGLRLGISLNLRPELTHEFGDVGVAGLAVAAEGDELNVVQAGVFDAPARYQTTAVGQQDDLEHDARVAGAGAAFVVVEACIQCVEVQLMINQVVQGELEGAALDLFGQHHGQ